MDYLVINRPVTVHVFVTMVSLLKLQYNNPVQNNFNIVAQWPFY